jgi:hypothetical protein
MTCYWRQFVIVSVVLTAACGGAATAPPSPSTPTAPSTPTTSFSGWGWTGTEWAPIGGTPPACDEPIRVLTPVSLDPVTSVLYPGQVRGGNYKAHGGFRFDRPGQSANIQIVAPMSGTLFRAAKYTERGELQILLDWIHPCGIMHRLDHIRQLTPRFESLIAHIPQAPGENSSTTNLPAGLSVAAGELIATAVGMPLTSNIFLDWGVYDLRRRNASSSDPAWLAQHNNEQHAYGVCWFSYLSPQDEARVRALPSADGQMGRTSDYCR